MNSTLGERLGRSVLALLLAVLLTGSNLARLSAWADAVVIPEEKRLVLTLGADLSEEQKEKIPKLRDQGYRVEVCKGFQQAADVIEAYMEGRLTA